MDRLRRAAGPSRANRAVPEPPDSPAVLPAQRRACGNRGRVPEAPEPQQHTGPRRPSVPFPTADPTTRARVPPAVLTAQPCCPRRGTCGNNKPQDQTAKPGPDLLERPASFRNRAPTGALLRDPAAAAAGQRPASRPGTGAFPGRNPSPALQHPDRQVSPFSGNLSRFPGVPGIPLGCSDTPAPQPACRGHYQLKPNTTSA